MKGDEGLHTNNILLTYVILLPQTTYNFPQLIRSREYLSRFRTPTSVRGFWFAFFTDGMGPSNIISVASGSVVWLRLPFMAVCELFCGMAGNRRGGRMILILTV